jgi:hypothetical protein
MILFAILAAIGGTVCVVVLVAWYRGLFDVITQYIETMGDILTGKEIIVHRISIEELLECYDDEDDEDDE